MDETTVAPPAYDENDIITHIFGLARCFAWVQKAMPVGALGACSRAGRLGEKGQHGLYRHFRPLIFSLFCSTAQQISFVSNNYGASRATVKKMSALAPSLVASTCQAPCASRSTLGPGLPLSSTSLMMQNDAARLVTGPAWGSTTAGPTVQAPAPALAYSRVCRRA